MMSREEKMRDEIEFACEVAKDELTGDDIDVDEAFDVLGPVGEYIAELDSTRDALYSYKYQVALSCLDGDDVDVGMALSNIESINNALGDVL